MTSQRAWVDKTKTDIRPGCTEQSLLNTEKSKLLMCSASSWSVMGYTDSPVSFTQVYLLKHTTLNQSSVLIVSFQILKQRL